MYFFTKRFIKYSRLWCKAKLPESTSKGETKMRWPGAHAGVPPLSITPHTRIPSTIYWKRWRHGGEVGNTPGGAREKWQNPPHLQPKLRHQQKLHWKRSICIDWRIRLPIVCWRCGRVWMQRWTERERHDNMTWRAFQDQRVKTRKTK